MCVKWREGASAERSGYTDKVVMYMLWGAVGKKQGDGLMQRAIEKNKLLEDCKDRW